MKPFALKQGITFKLDNAPHALSRALGSDPLTPLITKFDFRSMVGYNVAAIKFDGGLPRKHNL